MFEVPFGNNKGMFFERVDAFNEELNGMTQTHTVCMGHTMFNSFITESLILAQDERWRRA